MSDLAIRVENLGKQYRIGHPVDRYRTLRDRIAQTTRARVRSLRRGLTGNRDRDRDRGPEPEAFWALKDVSFGLKEGEVLGVIGRNGAGKSTLLKVLSRITEPTEGYADINGRIGSLLEVGTGFHPELSGRENVYLNGAILGMKQREIDRKFDEMVAFAEVEKFIDTPVKHYSSGMYLRLAFAVAAHFEPEILVIDEVLAVGDSQFQEKCLGKIRDVAGQGRTVLFVSHNMAVIKHLCNRCILLKAGRVATIGDASDAIADYLSESHAGSRTDIAGWGDRITNGEARLHVLEIDDGQGNPTHHVPVGGTVGFTLRGEIHAAQTNPTFSVIIHNSLGEPILDIRSIHAGLRLGRVHGPVSVRVTLDQVGLYPGNYFVSPCIMDSACRRDLDFVKLCCVLRVDPAPGPHGDLRLDPVWGKYWVPSLWERVEPPANGRSYSQSESDQHVHN